MAERLIWKEIDGVPLPCPFGKKNKTSKVLETVRLTNSKLMYSTAAIFPLLQNSQNMQDENENTPMVIIGNAKEKGASITSEQVVITPLFPNSPQKQEVISLINNDTPTPISHMRDRSLLTPSIENVSLFCWLCRKNRVSQNRQGVGQDNIRGQLRFKTFE